MTLRKGCARSQPGTKSSSQSSLPAAATSRRMFLVTVSTLGGAAMLTRLQGSRCLLHPRSTHRSRGASPLALKLRGLQPEHHTRLCYPSKDYRCRSQWPRRGPDRRPRRPRRFHILHSIDISIDPVLLDRPRCRGWCIACPGTAPWS